MIGGTLVWHTLLSLIITYHFINEKNAFICAQRQEITLRKRARVVPAKNLMAIVQ